MTTILKDRYVLTDTTLPTGAVERHLVWHAPFTKCDRETDYAAVWRKLDERERKVQGGAV